VNVDTMSLVVRHLNADSSFLLTFSPFENPTPSDLTSANGAYTVLIDPFLTGSSIVLASWFAKTVFNEKPSISHLSEIEEPDVILISQNKPDHCHKETLLQLRPTCKTVFACEPGAAKAMRNWDHFDPHRIHGLAKYSPKAKFGNSLRLPIPPLSPEGHPGELNISFIPAKNYVTQLHNGFGITYQAPTRTRTLASLSTIDLPKKPKYFHMPLSPASLPSSSSQPLSSPRIVRPQSSSYSSYSARVQSGYLSDYGPVPIGPYQHRTLHSRASNNGSSEFLSSSISSSTLNSSTDRLSIPFTFETDPDTFNFNDNPPTPAYSPQLSRNTSLNRNSLDQPPRNFSHQKSISSLSSHQTNASQVTAGRPKTLSVLYSPHGLPVADLQPYMTNHLMRTSAFPLTLLLHSFDHVQNPWWLGGNINAGIDGGMQIARSMMARVWLSAHDEAKDDRGLSVKRLKIKRASAEEVRRQLWRSEMGKGWTCDVRNLRNGAEMFIGPSRDLISGMEKNRDERLLRFAEPAEA
jgi:hypothetical protein